MDKPTDGGGIFCPPLLTDSDRKLKLMTPGAKYLVMMRKNSTDTLSKVSPFLIKKVIDHVCGGEVSACNKLRNGTIIIKTKNLSQASKLIKLSSLAPGIEVEVSEHNTLNYSKGVIYSNDLRGISENEILDELKPQNVGKVEKILKKSTEGILEETGLLVLTFNSTSLPSEIAVGYERVRIRTYIPLPLRCKSCYRYGHTAKSCTNKKICPNCSQEFHLGESDEPCSLTKSCINCQDENLDPKHSAYDKKCPIFLREKEIQAIITQEKVSKKKAKSIYRERHHSPNTTYSSVLRSQPTTDNETQSQPVKSAENNTNSKPIQRTVQDYSSILTDVDISEGETSNMETQSIASLSGSEAHSTSANKSFLVPKNISNKTKSKLKKKLITGNKKK